jgi:transposase
MGFIRKKKMKSGIVCAYNVIQIWDSEKKQPRQISKYLGVIGSDGAIIPKGTVPRGRPRKNRPILQEATERLIVDFGDGFFASESIKRSAVYESLADFFEKKPELLALMAYRLCCPGPMYNCVSWLFGNILGVGDYADKLSSQDISKMLVALGDEEQQRKFFSHYLKSGSASAKNVIIDATSLPNQIHSDFNAWGYNEGGVEKQFRFHCVVDQDTKKPLFYRNIAGNISDIAALKATVDELKNLGVTQSFALIDAGYCSAENLKMLREYGIDFLTRLPAGRTLYKKMVITHSSFMENTQNLILFGKRTLFVKHFVIDDLYGENGHLYMILDPERKNKDIQSLGIKGFLDKTTQQENQEKYAYDLKTAGIFMLISSKNIPINEVLQAYYTRQSIEQIFGFSKSELEILPIRHHSDATVKGYLFLQFLLLIIFIEIREKLKGKFTVEQAFLILRTLKCKIYKDKQILQELTKKQKEIFSLSSILVPDLNCGI